MKLTFRPLTITFDDDADSKQIVDALKATFLFFHLLPYRVDGLRASFHVEFQACRLQFLLDRSYKRLDISITSSLRRIEFLADHIIGIMLHVLQRQILQFTFQFIESQLVSQRRVKVGSFLTNRHLCLGIVRITDLAHQVHTIGNHDQDHPHILCKGKQQIAEVFTLDNRVFLIELLYTVQTVQDTSHLISILLLDLFNGQMSLLYLRYQVYSLDSIAL